MEKKDILSKLRGKERKVYDLFFVCEKNEVDKIIDSIKDIISGEFIQSLKLEKYTPVYKLKELLSGEPQYVTVIFSCSSTLLNKVKNDILVKKKIRHILLNVKNNRVKTSKFFAKKDVSLTQKSYNK